MTTEAMTALAIETLHRERCSCIIVDTDGRTTLCHQRGVADLYRLLTGTPEVLKGSVIADKVVGKGAAALMALGGIVAVYADVMSRPALELLRNAAVPATFDTLADNIINRAGTDICPVEKLCRDADTPEQCLPRITEFLNKIKLKS